MVIGYWFNSDIAAGVGAGADGLFRTSDDSKPKGNDIKDDAEIVSSIDSFYASYLKGPRGDAGRSAIVAEQVKKFWNGSQYLTLNSGTGNDWFTIPKSNMVLREWR